LRSACEKDVQLRCAFCVAAVCSHELCWV
jgi:hypothetical protein